MSYLHVNNTSGHKGVSWNKNSKKWQSCIRVDGKQLYLGLYQDKENAINAYIEAAKKYGLEDRLKPTVPRKELERLNRLKHKEAREQRTKEWIKNNPEKYKARLKKYFEKNKDIILEKSRLKNLEIRNEVISKYGGKCECCKESNYKFLTIDHTENNGHIHKKTDKLAKSIYKWLKKNNFPKDGFRLLCWNCNCARAYNNGVCPHQKIMDGYNEK